MFTHLGVSLGHQVSASKASSHVELAQLEDESKESPSHPTPAAGQTDAGERIPLDRVDLEK